MKDIIKEKKFQIATLNRKIKQFKDDIYKSVQHILVISVDFCYEFIF